MNRWSDADASKAIADFAKHGEDIALRVYTSRLIGRDSTLVLHGGGNTSVKTTFKNKVGDVIDVLAVKGSGWDLSNIEPAGFPLVDLDHCRKLVKLPELSDEDMVSELRSHMMDFKSPTPSVEALLHAHIPHKFVDHSHADAILALADQPTDDIAKKVFGDELGIVPYVMPGFILAKKVAEVYDANPTVKGLFLMKHGLFTWGATAKESYDRHIKYVERALNYIKNNSKNKSVENPITLTPAVSRNPAPPYEVVGPILRGLFYSFSNGMRFVIQRLQSESITSFVGSEEVSKWSQRGTCTPDHVIRTKGTPLLLLNWPKLENPTAPTPADVKSIAEYLREELQAFIGRYRVYFQENNERSKIKKIQLDPLPRLALVHGIGLLAFDSTLKNTQVSLDIYSHSIEIIKQAESIGTYSPVSMTDLWDMEYWTLEQAKLGTVVSKPCDGQVVFVTGGASGIGHATVKEFAKNGAHVFIADYNDEQLQTALKALKNPLIKGLKTDVTSEESVKTAFSKCVELFGGVDILVSNAGAPWQGPIGESTRAMEDSFKLNFWSHQYTSSATVQIILRQNEGSFEEHLVPMGGCLLFNTSKAAVNPGPNFGPYGANAIAKAATLALMKQYALEYGAQNIRSSAVNADRVRTQFFSEEVIEKRAKARGLTADSYFKTNLLEQEVLAEDVAKEFLNLALAMRTTAGVATVDGGNIAASMR